MRRVIRHALPPALVDAVRDLRALPSEARGAWWRTRWLHHGKGELELLPAVLTPPITLVTLCYGNIYRSPFAAALLEQEAAARQWKHVTVVSAGFVEREGRRSPDDARMVAQEFGVSLDAHASARFSRRLADMSSLLLVMDRRHEALLLHEHPHLVDRVVPLWRFGVPRSAPDIVLHDPYGNGIEAVRDCFGRIAVAVRALAIRLDALTQHAQHLPPDR
jgi:protein-tyrosine phosphatase